MRKKILILSAIGFVYGMIMGNLIAYFTGGTLVNSYLAARTGSEAASVLLQTLLSGLLGAIALGSTVVYDIERWPLLLTSVVHYLILEISYVIIALALRWVTSPQGLLIMLGIQLVVYLIIWLIMYFRYRRKVRELNRLLRESRGQEPPVENHSDTKKTV